MTNRAVPYTNNVSERHLRPSVIFRKVTNGFRCEWGAETYAAFRSVFIAIGDPIIQRIERFRCPRGALLAERRNRGYTLYSAQSGALVARLRPTNTEDSFEVLYWSLWKERWVSTGPFGHTPSCRSMTRYASSPMRISSGL
jgi:hypothetical protein